jgi:virginiamycin B lyase
MLKLSAVAVPLAMAAGAVVFTPVAKTDTPDIKEWTVPWERSRPRDPFVDGKGRVWFVGQQGNYVAYLEPASGKFRRFEIASGTHPHNLVVDAKGMVWFTGNRNGTIGRLDPATGTVKTYAIPDKTVDDPHTMVVDGAGVVWFTAQQADAVGRLDPATGAFRFWRTGDGTRPYGIIVDRRGRPWFDLFGTNELATIDPKTMNLERHRLPDAGARPRRIGMTTDGALWYTDYTRGFLGRLDPGTGKVEEFPLPGGRVSLPYGLAVDDRDRIWVAETGVRPNRIVAFDGKTRRLADSVALGGGAAPNTVRHMVFHAPTREVWFGTDRNTVGRVRVP